ncbi:MAG TPA: Ig-like domain-containing protein [Anaerolineales bacterium]|nr:Ig-like domain-containing protein [Anaerolineales bacterium]
MQLRPRRRPVLLLAALGLGGGLLLAAALSAPRLVAIAPADSSESVSSKAPLRITFSRPMDRASVESGLAIDPRPAGTLRWDGTTLVFEPSEAWPVGGHVSVRLAGARSAQGLPLLGGAAWSFEIGVPRVAYLWPADGPADIYVRALDDSDPVRLTTTAGVLDFQVTADGAALVYSAQTTGGDSELRRRDLSSGADEVLYACPAGSICRQATLSPDGQWLAFEQEDHGSDTASAAEDSVAVRLYSVGSNATAFAVAPADHSTTRPSWSPANALAYYDQDLRAYAFLNHPGSPEQSPDSFVPNALGDRGVWSPDGESFVFPELVFVAASPTDGSEGPPVFYSHLYRLNVGSGAILDLSGEEGYLVEDAGAAYSPDGLWLTFSRKYLDRPRWTLGRQIWRMRSDGLDPEPLTDEPTLNHSALAWSPDGQYLVYMLFDQMDMTRPAEIWWRSADGSGSGQLAVGGYAPAWTP